MPDVEQCPNCVPYYVQTALDCARADLLLLKEQMESWRPFMVDIEDLYSRVDNWQFNAWRHLEDILA